MGACDNGLVSESLPQVKMPELVATGTERMSFMEILYGSGQFVFLLFSSDFYLFKLILKSRVSQQYFAANIFVCMRVSWQFLGL